MLIGTMTPIPKVKWQVVCKSDNFRAITLSSIIGEVLDWIILIKEQNSLCTSDLQFGFKQGFQLHIVHMLLMKQYAIIILTLLMSMY